MRRREYLVGASVGVIGLAGASTGSGSQESFERLLPDAEVTVAPETEVLFEAAVPDGTEPTDVEWSVADELRGGAWTNDYAYVTGTAARSIVVEDVGQYEVSAAVDGDELTWTVTVDEEAPGRPTIESLTTDPGTEEVVGVDAAVTVTADAHDPEDRLSMLVWQEGRNHTVLESAALEDGETTATLELEETPHWIQYGYPTMVLAVCDDGRVSESASDDGPQVRQPFEVEILETNSPVAAGEELSVDVEVANVGDMMMVGPNEQEVRLVVADDVVDAEDLSLSWNETTERTLSFETYPVERDVTFDVRVECEDDADETEVEVYALRDEVDVAITGTNAPVTAGERLEVTAEVTNHGGRDVDEELALEVGGDVVDTTTVSVGAGDSATATLGYTTYEVAQDVSFSVTLSGSADSDETTVEVFADEPGNGDGALAVSISQTNAPVTGGEYLEVLVGVGNNGPGDASGDVELVVGGEVVDSQSVFLEPEATETIALGYDTYAVRTDVTVDLTVRSPDDSASTSVTVFGTN